MPSLKPITITAATTLSRNVHANAIVNVNSTTGRAITLPAATGTGDVYTLYFVSTVSSGSHTVVRAGSDVIIGAVGLTTDIAGTTMPAASTTATITMNGSTTGGVIGSMLRLTDAISGKWMLEGNLICTGTEATPFS
jgi:hypothetical protein